MTRQEAFVKRFRELQDKAFEIVQKKNSDYANDRDPFANLTSSQHVGVHPALAVLVREMDKITRMANLIERKGVSAVDESLEDTAIDASNYPLLALMVVETMLSTTRTAPPQSPPSGNLL